MTKEESKPDIIKFLLGDEPYEDLWFGERKGIQQFWWRTNLRSYQENIQKQLSELRKENEELTLEKQVANTSLQFALDENERLKEIIKDLGNQP